MSTNTSKAGMFNALSKVATTGMQGVEGRQAAQLAKRKGELELSRVNETMDTGAVELQIEAVNEQNKEVTRKLQKANMFRGLKRHSVDGNPRHLNELLKGGPMSKSGIVRFNKVDLSADNQLIAQAPEGFDPEDFTEQPNRYMKAIMNDGSERIVDLYKVKQAYGYFKDLDDQEVSRELVANEAKKAGESGGRSYSPGALEKDAKYLSGQGHGSESDVSGKLYKDKIAGNTAGKLDLADQATEELNTKFEGDFIANFDSSNEQHRDTAYRYIRDIEQYEGVKFSSAERKEYRDISVLLALGEPGKELTAEETGIIDSRFSNIKKYITDTGGSEGVAAYAAFRNSMRHALYGSALTESEIKSFNEQFGTRSQKLGPLLKQMKTAMSQVQAKLGAIADMQNPYSAKFRIGASQEKADAIVGALQQRIDHLESLAKGQATDDPAKSEEDNRAAARQRIRDGI